MKFLLPVLFLICGYLLGFANAYYVGRKDMDMVTQYLSDDYIYGVPPPPPFVKYDLEISKGSEDCGVGDEPVIGYVIEVKEGDYPSHSVIIQDLNGAREDFSFDDSSMPNALHEYPAQIFIPGAKVKIKAEYCGSGGYPWILNVETLSR